MCSGSCAPGQTNCSGNTPQTCSAAGTWTNQATCAQPSPDCKNGSCTCLETLCGGTTCTTLSTIQNCAACGNACNATNATTAGCSGTTCTYTCGAGFADCNAAAPNTGGCACPAASTSAQGTVGGCCGSGCQTQHKNGVGGNYYDCVPPGTYNPAQATEAANSDTGQAGTTGTYGCGSGADTESLICKTTGGSASCTCWTYAATGADANALGHISASSSGCFCPGSGDPTWN